VDIIVFNRNSSYNIQYLTDRIPTRKRRRPPSPTSQRRQTMLPSTPALARLRIVAINDCYELTNLPKLHTFIQKTKPHAVLLPGDFLSPSPLSSVDGGRGMVETLRAVGITHVSLGNHEADLKWPQLQKRLKELTRHDKVQFVNTNLRQPPPENKLGRQEWIMAEGPPYSIITTQCDRVRVALLGLISDEEVVFRDGTFRGAPITNVIDSYTETYQNIMQQEVNDEQKRLADYVIPMTHMSMDRDKVLARTMLELYSTTAGSTNGIILGGHEHEPYDVKIQNEHADNYVRILKSGSDAEQATLVDLTFDAEHPEKPLVDLEADIVSMKPYEPSVLVQKIVKKHMSILDSLNHEMIVHAETMLPPGTPLSSERSRFQQTTVGAVLCKAIKDELENVDACIINGATIKGNAVYQTDQISYGELKKELPFPTKMVVVPMKRWELLEAIDYSRRYNEEGVDVKEVEKKEGKVTPRRGYLQVDLDFMNAEGVSRGAPMLEETLRVALPRNLLNGFCRIKPLMDLGKRLKEEGMFPGPNDFVPALLLIVRHFSKNIWLDIVKEQFTFDDIDVNGDHVLDRDEIAMTMEKFLGHKPPEFFIDDMIDAIDVDDDGVIDAGEFSYLIATMDREDVLRKL